MRIITFSTKNIYLPEFSYFSSKVKTFKGLKEWSYLSPKYFKPSKEEINKYNLSGSLFHIKTNIKGVISKSFNI